MGFATGYRNGKAIGGLITAVTLLGLYFLTQSGACGSTEVVEVGDTTECLYLKQPVKTGDVLTENIVESVETTIDSTKFDCARSYILYKNRAFESELEQGTMLLPGHFIYPGREMRERY